MDSQNLVEGLQRNGHIRIAVDIGGTFTDGVAEWTSTGEVRIAKSLTTPDDLGSAVRTVISELLSTVGPSSAVDVDEIMHGTTLVTNAITTRRGAKTALVVTRGTRDTLEIRRELRYHLYDLALELPAPLVPLERCFELEERIAFDGTIATIPSRGDVQLIAARLRKEGIESVAVCFLHSFVNPTNEETVGELLSEYLPGVAITLSSRIVREAREYERMTTAAANAYTRPLMQDYLTQLCGGIAAIGIDAPIHIMVSNGGFTSAEAAAVVPIALLESGPAAGVISATNAATEAGMPERVLAFDMGGTTAKACVVIDGRPRITHSFETARVRRFRKGSGLPILVTSIDLIEIGAGGGSIAEISELGMLTVGPRSAEGTPGPACYGRGGSDLTVTDADLLLGYIDPDAFLGGRMKLKPEFARDAASKLGREVDMDPLQIAAGVRDIVDENMASAARVHIAERGYDPRDFLLVATGGAGPVHAVGVAMKLGIRRILCPIAAGAGSCLGLLAAPAQGVRSWTHLTDLSTANWEQISTALERLHTEVREEVRSAGASNVTWRIELEMRYAGQGHGVNVVIPYRNGLDASASSTLAAAFEEEYRRVYGGLPPSRSSIEVLNWRVFGTAETTARPFKWPHRAKGGTSHAALPSRRVYRPGDKCFEEVPAYARYLLPPGIQLRAPVVLQEAESTLVIPTAADVEILPAGGVIITLEDRK